MCGLAKLGSGKKKTARCFGLWKLASPELGSGKGKKKGSSYFGARKLLDKLTGVVQNGPAWEGGLTPKSQHSSVTFRIFSIYFICVCLYSWKRRNSHFICLCKFFRWFPKYQVGKFFYLFLGDRILTNWTDKKSCCKSNGHRCLATKAEHLPPLQKQPCRSSGTR